MIDFARHTKNIESYKENHLNLLRALIEMCQESKTRPNHSPLALGTQKADLALEQPRGFL